MWSYEIIKALQSYDNFLGVFARNKIPSVVEYPSFIIINTDRSTEPGTHWVAIRFTATVCEYFDSFGLPPMYCEISKAIGTRKLLWNGRCIQHPTSKTCGEFCIAFVKMRSKNLSYVSFIKLFSRDTIANDKIVTCITYDD